MKRIALLGMPNTGKSTFFNRLTGASARVGNWPGITVDAAGRVHVVWLEQSGSGPTLRHASKDPAGRAFGPGRRLTDSGARPMPHSPRVAADRVGNVHVVWSDARRGDPDILHRRRDGSGGWSEIVRVNAYSTVIQVVRFFVRIFS